MFRIVKKMLLGSVLSAGFLVPMSTVHATVILDVDTFGASDAGGGMSAPDGSFRRAQTFTVGTAGTLQNIIVQARDARAMRILSTSGGVPTFTQLASSISFTSAGGFLDFDLSAAPLGVSVGEVLAIDLLDTNLGGLWFGSSLNPYAGGDDFFVNTSCCGLDWNSHAGYDWHFQTYVNTPEPASLALLGLGLAGLGFSRRKSAQA